MVRFAVVLLCLGGPACAPAASDDPTPSELGWVKTLTSQGLNGKYDAVAVKGKYLYLAQDSIHIFEVKDGKDATEIGVSDDVGVFELVVRGDRLFYVDGDGVKVADISVPSTIKHLGPIEDGEFGGFALAAIAASPTQMVVPSLGVGPDNEIILFDLIHPEKPEQVARFFAGGGVAGLAIDGETLYVATATFLEIYDVSNWDAPRKLSTLEGSTGRLFALGQGIVLCGQGGSGPGKRPVLDARDPTAPKFPVVEAPKDNQNKFWFFANDFMRVGSYVYALSLSDLGNYNRSIVPVDVKDPLHPIPMAFDGPTQQALGDVSKMAVDSRFVYALVGVTARVESALILERRLQP